MNIFSHIKDLLYLLYTELQYFKPYRQIHLLVTVVLERCVVVLFGSAETQTKAVIHIYKLMFKRWILLWFPQNSSSYIIIIIILLFVRTVPPFLLHHQVIYFHFMNRTYFSCRTLRNMKAMQLN